MENTKAHAVQHCGRQHCSTSPTAGITFAVRVCGHDVLAELDFTPCGPTTTVSQNASGSGAEEFALSEPLAGQLKQFQTVGLSIFVLQC